VLSMTRMNRVLAVDTSGYTMTVESGCVLKTIQDTAAEHDRLFPLSLGAEGSCAIGGNLSTNAGGVQVLHYGNARNLVLGLEVVLSDGRIWNGLRALKKDNTGYDLKNLFMGAEGTLGIITKAVLKLWPKPKDVATAWLAVRDPAAALEVLSGAHSASEDNVTSCELLHRDALDGVFKHVAGVVDPLPARNTWFLLMEWSSSRPRVEGAEGMLEKMEAYLAEGMERGLVLDAVLAQAEAQARNMWKIREGHAEASRAEGPSASFDISVAVAKIPEFIEQASAAAREVLPTVRPRPFGHMGDGNLHFGFAAPAGMDRATWRQYTPGITRCVHDLLQVFDGSISAEHGIGSEKIEELEHYRSQVELDVMRAVKRALDPKNLMNPGKILRL
jgi:FAD/FMN-containing dehydrogenase